MQEKEKDQQEEYELWRNKDEEEQIAEIKMEENQRHELGKRKEERNSWKTCREVNEKDDYARKEDDDLSSMTMRQRRGSRVGKLPSLGEED